MSSNPVRRRPPTVEPSYDWNTDGQQAQSQYGNFIFKSTTRVTIRRPTWKGTETIFRPYPSLDYRNPELFEPYRRDNGGGNYTLTNWIRRYDAAYMVGSPPITFLTHDPRDRSHYDPGQTPLGILNSAIRNAIRNKQEQPGFGALLQGETGKGAQLDRVKSIYLMQGLLMVHNSEVQYGNGKVPPGAGDRTPCVMILPGGFGGSQFSLGPKLISMLDEEVENYDGDPEDFESRYRYGDPVSLATGRYLRMFQKGTDPQARYQAQPQARGPLSFQRGADQPAASATKEIAGYEIHFDTQLADGTPANLDTPEWEDTVREKWLYWEEVLDFPTHVQQAHMLNKVFPANAIVFAFENYNRDWIEETTWDSYLQRESASVPAAPPGARRYGEPAFAPPGRPAGQQVLLPAPGARYQPPAPPADPQSAQRGFGLPARRAEPLPEPQWGYQPDEHGAYAEESAEEPGQGGGSFDDDLASVPSEYENGAPASVAPAAPPAAPAPRVVPTRPAAPPVVPVTPRPPARRATAVPDVVAPAGIPEPGQAPPAPAAPAKPAKRLSPSEIAAKKAAEMAARVRT